MGSLNKCTGQRLKEKSKLIKFPANKTNPNVKADIDAELDNGWHIATSWFDSQNNEVRIVFTKPKRNG